MQHTHRLTDFAMFRGVIVCALLVLCILTVSDGVQIRVAVGRHRKFQLPAAGSGTPPIRIENTLLEDSVDETVSEDGGTDTKKAGLYCGSDCDAPTSSQLRNYTVHEAENGLAFETLYANGTRTLTRLRIQEQIVDYINTWRHHIRSAEMKAASQGAKSRKKRAVFGFDDRFEINVLKYITMYPFSAAVKLSTGCTGVLISTEHVLTAAHCLHDGKRYVADLKEIRAGFRRDRLPGPDEDENEKSFFWIRVDKAYLPYEWTQSGHHQLPLAKDYAVIRLRRSPERKHIEVGMGDTGSLPTGTMVHFSSFDYLDRAKLFYRFCTVMDGTQDMFYQQCDGAAPSIGAGIYVRQWDPEQAGWSRRVVGVYGGYASFTNSAGFSEKRNIALRITPLKFAQICFWVTGNYGDCKA